VASFFVGGMFVINILIPIKYQGCYRKYLNDLD
jgi:hypothetical protein